MNQIEKVINVAVLLPEEIAKFCRKINGERNDKSYISFEEDYQPHVTLCMGIIPDKVFSEFLSKVEEILRNHRLLTLTIEGRDSEHPGVLKVTKSNGLADLHAVIKKVFRQYGHWNNPAPEMFAEPEKISSDASLLKYLRRYDMELSGEYYDPHITVGEGSTYVEPKSFTADTVGICQVGPHGSYKKELGRIALSEVAT